MSGINTCQNITNKTFQHYNKEFCFAVTNTIWFMFHVSMFQMSSYWSIYSSIQEASKIENS